jgi:putative thiamine transport system permease protein
LALLLLLPLLASVVFLLPGLLDLDAFGAMLAHPQFAGALNLSLFTGFVATALALFFSILVIERLGAQAQSRAGIYLAVPHLALAIGFGFLIAPTGLMARVIATLFTGWTSPPQWHTTQDPTGLALIAALVLKEVPFLVWAMASVLNQDELKQRFAREVTMARSLGHGPRSAFWRITLPQLLPRIIWPLVAVFTYGLTVVDMALVIGPTQPPTLAQLIWTDLNDAERLTNARGAAGTFVLTLVAVAMLGASYAVLRLMRKAISHWMTRAPRPEHGFFPAGRVLWRIWFLIYLCVIAALTLQSVSALWPFPQLLSEHISFVSWQRVVENGSPVLTSLTLAIATSTMAVLASVVWFETQPERRDRLALSAALAVLCLPALLLALGQYRLLLQLGWTGTGAGLLLVHAVPVAAYVFVMLQGPYRAYDTRWQSVSHGLAVKKTAFLTQVKWPMLGASLLSAWAIGFAVSLAQFVAAQLAAAGRFSTLPMEAVTLTSGGNRAIMAAYGLLLMLLPLAGFAVAAWLGKPRWKVA